MEENIPPSTRSIPILDDTNGVVKLVREQPPEYCILKIESFDVLQDAASFSSKDHIKSTEFKAGGYTWVLSVYAKGNRQEDGDGHLSLYVTLIDKLDSDTIVNASVRFFIYDQIRNNYLTFLDVGDRSFHSLKTTWGIPKVLPLDTFSDASNGFLVNDCCTFGAGVLLRDGEIKRTVLSLLEPDCDRRYTWKIKHFSSLNQCLESPAFSFGQWSWKLRLYPRGYSIVKGKDMSLFLVLDNVKDLTCGSKLYAQFRLGLIHQYGIKGRDYKFTGHNWYYPKRMCLGYTSFISISDLYNASKGFLVNDTLIVEAKIQVMSILKAMDGEDGTPTDGQYETPTKRIKASSYGSNSIPRHEAFDSSSEEGDLKELSSEEGDLKEYE